MIVETSALVAIMFAESDAEIYANAMAASSTNRMSAASYLESSVVADRARNPTISRHLDEIIRNNAISIESFTAEQAIIARQAYRDFGKGSGHPAGLNFGDCFAYALAKDLDEPLLYKGDDFGHTDVRSALD